MRSTFKIAAYLFLIVLLWIVVGYIFPGDKGTSSRNILNSSEEKSLPKVRIEDSIAVKRKKIISLIGITKPFKQVEVKAEISGKVDKILAKEGKAIKKGDVILVVEKRNRQAKLEELEARYEQKKITYESSKKLSASGLQSKSRLAQAKSEKEAARAGLIQAEIDYGNTVIKAPFSGILEEINVEVGDYLQVGFGSSSGGSDFAGKAIAKIIDNTPYIVEAGVSERLIGQVKEGDLASVNLVDGTKAEGVVSYISKIADKKTRSFKVEITVDSEQGAPSGLTASVEIIVGEELSHKVSSSVLALDPEGRLGIKYLESDSESLDEMPGIVRFHTIEIYDSEADGVWVTGLDKKIKLITLGAAFVEIGSEVIGVYKQPDI